MAGSVLGTASYISPEQASGAVATAAADVYALGVVAYQCLSGHRPFDGSTPIEIAMKHVRDTPRPLPADIPPAVRAIVDRALAKDPGARWPTASAMAAVARQAASSLTTQLHHPAVNGAAPVGRPQSGGPAMNRPQHGGPAVANRPRSGAPASGPPGHPVSGPGRPPYPPIPRPVSGSQARGAASVPSGQGAYRHPSAPPMQQGKQPEGSGGRQVLIVLAVVLALLVLLCAGVISFLLNQGNAAMGEITPPATVARAASVEPRAPVASYRLTKQAAAPLSLNHATEGRQTL